MYLSYLSSVRFLWCDFKTISRFALSLFSSAMLQDRVDVFSMRLGGFHFKRSFLGCWVLGSLLFLAPSISMAVSSSLPSDTLIRSRTDSYPLERPPLPDFQQDSEPEIMLPPLSPPPQEKLSSHTRLYVERIELTGNTVFLETELSSITAGYEGREISPEELQALRHELTLYYVNRGYINSGAVIPDQQVKDGVVNIHIVEGRLTGVELSGNERLRDAYILNRLRLGLDGPLNMNTLGKNILTMHDSSVVKRIKARLKPGELPGEGVLYAEVEEKKPWQGLFQLGNDRSPSIGSERLGTYLAHHNLTGWGDTLDVRSNLTDGLTDFEVSYNLPLNANDTMLRLWHMQSDSVVVEEPFDFLDISSETKTYGLSINHPLYERDDQKWYIGAILERREGETFLFGEPFSFSAGSDDGKMDVNVIRLSQDFLLRQTSRVLSCRQLFNLGFADLGPVVSDRGPDDTYFFWLAQAQWAERLGTKGVHLVSRLDMQLTGETLPYLERFAYGGADKVRGYREDFLVRDNGIIASIEARLPVGRLPLLKISREMNDGILYLAPFFDWGRSWDEDDTFNEPKSISSLGIGLRWDPSPSLHTQVYFALPLNDDGIDQKEHNLQDSGIHFNLAWQFM